MKKKLQKKSEVLREGYVQGLRKAQTIINEMLLTESTQKMTTKEVYKRYDDILVVSSEFEHIVEKSCSLVGYNAGVYGHNYNVYSAGGTFDANNNYRSVCIVCGNRPCKGIDVDRKLLLQLKDEWNEMNWEQRREIDWGDKIVEATL